MTYMEQRAWSDKFLPEVMEIVHRNHHLLPRPAMGATVCIADEMRDMKQATDAIITHTGEVCIAIRIRRFKYLPSYRNEFTIRIKSKHGGQSELAQSISTDSPTMRRTGWPFGASSTFPSSGDGSGRSRKQSSVHSRPSTTGTAQWARLFVFVIRLLIASLWTQPTRIPISCRFFSPNRKDCKRVLDLTPSNVTVTPCS